MSESAKFRSRAKECRDLAKGARDRRMRLELDEMADALDAEAAIIEEEETAQSETRASDHHILDSIRKLNRSRQTLKDTARDD